MKFSSKNETFLQICKKQNRGYRIGRRRGTFFFIHFDLFQPNSQDSARRSASLRSEKKMLTNSIFVVVGILYFEVLGGSTGLVLEYFAASEEDNMETVLLANFDQPVYDATGEVMYDSRGKPLSFFFFLLLFLFHAIYSLALRLSADFLKKLFIFFCNFTPQKLFFTQKTCHFHY